MICRQACHDYSVFDLTAGRGLMDLVASGDVLKRCAHFDMAETIESASTVSGRFGDDKRERVAKIEEQLCTM